MAPPSSFYGRMGRLSAIVFILPSAMAAGGLAGYFLVDPWLQTYPWGTIVLTLVFAGAGFYQIFKLLTAGSPDPPSGGRQT